MAFFLLLGDWSPSAEPPAAGAPPRRESIETHGSTADALQRQLESQLESWKLKDGAAELQFVHARQLPRYRKDPAGEPLQQATLRVGESFGFVERHFSLHFTLRSVSEQVLEFDYEQLTSHPGQPRLHDTGTFSLSPDLTQTGFQDQWRSCSTSAQCMVLATGCDGFVGVSKGTEEFAALSFRKRAAKKACSAPMGSVPFAACVNQRCTPAPP